MLMNIPQRSTEAEEERRRLQFITAAPFARPELDATGRLALTSSSIPAKAAAIHNRRDSALGPFALGPFALGPF